MYRYFCCRFEFLFWCNSPDVSENCRFHGLQGGDLRESHDVHKRGQQKVTKKRKEGEKKIRGLHRVKPQGNRVFCVLRLRAFECIYEIFEATPTHSCGFLTPMLSVLTASSAKTWEPYMSQGGIRRQSLRDQHFPNSTGLCSACC